MADIFYQPKSRILSQDGSEVGAGYKFYFYQTNTTTPITTYSNPGLSNANSNPVLADQYGYLTTIYVSDFSQVKVIVRDADDNLIYTVDPVNPSGSSSITLNDLGVRPTSYWGLTAGTASAYTLVANPTLPAYSNMNSFLIQFHVACNAAPTLNIDGLGALNLKKYTGQGSKVALQAGDVQATERYLCINDGVDILVLNPRGQVSYLGAASTETIATGVVVLDNNSSNVLIETEGGGASDDLDTINGGGDGQEILIGLANASRNVVLKHNTGNIFNPGLRDITLDLLTDKIRLVYSSAQALWIVDNTLTKVYTSADQTITANAQITLSHALGRLPDVTFITLTCTSNDAGYTAGQIVPYGAPSAPSSASFNRGISLVISTTQLILRYGDAIELIRADTGVLAVIDPTKWTLQIKAFAWN